MNNSAFSHANGETRAETLPAPIGPHLFPPDVKTVGVVSISYLMPASDFASATNALRASGVYLHAAPSNYLHKLRKCSTKSLRLS